MCMSLLNVVFLAVIIANSDAYSEDAYSDTKVCPALQKEPWSYSGQNGPEYWGETYAGCYGSNQSPISIETLYVLKDKSLAPLSLVNYDKPITKAKVENNGHAIEVVPEDGVDRTILVNGETYFLHQFHFHWGSTYNEGSEHNIDGVNYAMEMHLVHMNVREQIAVIGLLFQEVDASPAGSELQKVVDELKHVRYKGTNTELRSSFYLNRMWPVNPTSFYRYNGSLTTPGCSEGVSWTILQWPILVGRSQMEEFREVYSTKKEDSKEGCELSGNHRPVQPLNGRKVYLSK